MRKPIPIGVEFYKRMIEDGYYYVDKTLMIKDILDAGTSVNLFTRPRRFGKTLALSMLQAYFEDERSIEGTPIDNSHYFDGMKITSCGEKYTGKMGKYPVINMTLKSAKQPTFDMAYAQLVDGIRKEFRRHWYVHESDALFEDEKEKYESIMVGKAEPSEYATALAFLSECLQKYHNQNVIILIDEYDVPLENAYFSGFYEEMITFIRSLFESALKTNQSLEFAVITGCIVSTKVEPLEEAKLLPFWGRESIFTGLNNLKVNSILQDDCAEHFGFTPYEVQKALEDYGMENQIDEVKTWYDGYLFGQTEVYNPWSVICYLEENKNKEKIFPKPYWSNTSSNSIVRELIEEADFETRNEIEELIAGGTIEKPVHEDITYGDIHESQDNLWNFLFFTGYLKKVGERFEEETIYLKMAIPNAEIRYVYRNTILTWFDKKVRVMNRTPFVEAFESGDCAKIETFVSEQLQDTISFFDYAENYYHGFLVGLLKGAGRYLVKSNRESGSGRPDIVMMSPSVRGKAFIMELKVAKEFRQMEATCEKAIEQAVEENYRAELEHIGYSDITIYGICFYRKECMVMKKENTID